MPNFLVGADEDGWCAKGKMKGCFRQQRLGLTRDHIFEGLYQRRTYGTTGARILLDFVIDGEPMGQRVAVDGLPRLGIEAHGTDIIELLEVLRCRASERVFKVIKSLTPGVTDFVWNGTDTTFNEDSIYYIRLRQKTLVRTRLAMAWSSPIWVTRRG